MSTLAGNLPILGVMLKVLLVHPKIPALENAADILRRAGAGVLQLEDPSEVLQVLGFHGKSVDIAVIHRESVGGRGNPGVSLLESILADADQRDLPMILSSSVWSESEAAAHQQSPFGVNAYLPVGFTGDQVIGLIGEVLDLKIVPLAPEVVHPAELASDRRSSESGAHPVAPVSKAPPSSSSLTSTIQLQEVAELLDVSHQVARPLMTGTFVLENPILPPPPATATSVMPLPVQGVPQAEAVSDDVSVPIPEAPLAVEVSLPSFTKPHSPVELEQIEVEQPDFAQLDSASEPVDEIQLESDSQDLPLDLPSGLGWAEVAVQGGEALVPGAVSSASASVRRSGGSAESADDGTLKQYLALREQDVAALASQLKLSKGQIQQLEDQLRLERARSIELSHTVDSLKRELDDKGSERNTVEDRHQAEMAEMRFQLKVKADRVRLLEVQVRENSEESERLQERVRVDIRRVRVREKELENRLEILRKDSEALLAARETKLVELKRKIDLLEFNLDLLQNQNLKEKESSRKLREQLTRVAQAVRVAGGLLQSGGSVENSAADLGNAGESPAIDRAKGPGAKSA